MNRDPMRFQLRSSFVPDTGAYTSACYRQRRLVLSPLELVTNNAVGVASKHMCPVDEKVRFSCLTDVPNVLSVPGTVAKFQPEFVERTRSLGLNLPYGDDAIALKHPTYLVFFDKRTPFAISTPLHKAFIGTEISSTQARQSVSSQFRLLPAHQHSHRPINLPSQSPKADAVIPDHRLQYSLHLPIVDLIQPLQIVGLVHVSLSASQIKNQIRSKFLELRRRQWCHRMDLVQQIQKRGMVRLVMLEWMDGCADDKDVNALGKAVGTFERDNAFAEFAHCHQ